MSWMKQRSRSKHWRVRGCVLVSMVSMRVWVCTYGWMDRRMGGWVDVCLCAWMANVFTLIHTCIRMFTDDATSDENAPLMLVKRIDELEKQLNIYRYVMCYVQLRNYACLRTDVYLCFYVRICVSICVCMYACVCVCCACIHTYINWRCMYTRNTLKNKIYTLYTVHYTLYAHEQTQRW